MADYRENRGGRDSGDKGDRGMRPRRSRRKVCQFCADKIEHIDYKDSRIKKFISERGKILPKRMSGTCAHHQRELTIAIKRARLIALLPFAGD
jgi:small subunit ribosomal protein S18